MWLGIHCCAAALLLLATNLNGQINQRNNHADGAKHLTNCINHFPIHNGDYKFYV